MRNLQVIAFIAPLFLSGCFSPSIYVSSLTDKNYQISKNSKIAIYDSVEEAIEVKSFYSTLRQEMERLGFQFIPSQNADYFLVANIDEKSSTISGVLPMSTNSYSSGTVGGTYYSGTTTSTSYVPYTRRYTVKTIYLVLLDINRYTNEKKVVHVWEGYIGAEKEVYEKNTKDCLFMLLQYFGTNFKGHVDLKHDKTRTQQ